MGWSSSRALLFEHDVTQRLTLMMTRHLTATPSAHVAQCLCCKESLLLIPSAAASLLIRTLSAPSANHWYLMSICPSVTPVQPRASRRPGRPGLRPSGMGPLLTEMKNAPKFFPSASECSEESSLISPPSLGVHLECEVLKDSWC